MAVRIVTDSACDLPTEQVTELGIEVVPLSIRFGREEFVDRVELSVEDFYRRMATSDTLPETAAPAPGAFEKAFRSLGDAGADAVVCINMSSDLSATIQSAQGAAQALEGEIDVRVIDSRSVTVGLGSQVVVAATAAREGANADEVVAVVDDVIPRTRVYGTLDTLENLQKGGRIGNARALLGTLLSFKPGIEVRNGVVEEAGKPRTRRKALQWLADKVMAEPAVENLWVLHGQAPDLDEFFSLISSRYPRDEVRIGVIGPVVGTHAGPRVMGVCYHVPR